MLPLLKELCENVPGPIAALPVPYRTTVEKPTMQTLCAHDKMYMELEPHLMTRFEMAQFAKQATELGVRLAPMHPLLYTFNSACFTNK